MLEEIVIIWSPVFIFFSILLSPVRSSTVSYSWDVTWVWAAPDGYGRPVVGINNQWPCPGIDANVGDTVVINLNNKLGNQTTGLHFHGVNQLSTTDMDGPSGVTQCAIPPDTTVTYQFTADAPGTFWYHSHDMGQYPDGLRGTLIVHDPNDPYNSTYDEEVMLTVSDWYHNSSIVAVQNMLTPNNTQFAPPIPDSLIVNEGQGSRINFTKGRTYRLRIINFAAFGSAMFHFQSHTMSIISNDGAYSKKTNATQLRVTPAQRFDVLLSASSKDSGNYPFLVSLDINRDWTNSSSQLRWGHNYTGYLVMDSSQSLSKTDVVHKWAPIDDASLAPYDGAAAYGSYDRLIKLDFKFCRDQNGYPRSCFNNLTYIQQQVPTLYSVATTGDQNTDAAIYGQVNPFIVNYNDTVQIVLNNIDASTHPFHLHGHHFQVLARGASGAGKWSGRDSGYASTPSMRDTIAVMPNSYTVLRFKATNPGVWLFHCHIEWHVEMGLTATIIEAPDRLRNLTFPSDHIAACQKMGTPYQGNAAGNTQNVTDTAGFITVPPTTYTGASYTTTSSKVRRGPVGRFFHWARSLLFS